MQHVISRPGIQIAKNRSYTQSRATTNFFGKFITWCGQQEENRFLWLGISIMAGIGTILPITLSAIVFIGGNDMALWIVALIVNVPILAVNLAAQPTKTTLPVLFFAWAVDAILIGYCLVHAFLG